MSGERYGVLFGELRSLLSSEAGSKEGFEALVLVLSVLRREAPERFEAEALPYVSELLERWYARASHSTRYAVTGRVALAALQADVSWLKVVRALDLREERKAGAALDALLACTQLTRLETLAPPERLSSAGLRRLVSSPLMSRLVGLRLWGREVGGELEAWATQPPERLRELALCFCKLNARIVAPLLALSGQLERLELDYSTMEGMEQVLREGSWGALKTLELPKGSGRGDCEALVALTRRTSLEMLTADDVRWPTDAAAALWRAAGLAGLKRLEVAAAQGAPTLSLDAILSGPQASSLETLELKGVSLEGDATPGACPRLTSLSLRDITPEALRWMAAHELPALRTLNLNDLPDEALSAAMEGLCDAARGLDKLTLWLRSGQLNDAALGALVWRAAQALDVEMLSLYVSEPPLEPHAAALMRDTIEHMPRLKSFHISPRMISAEAAEMLRGSRAATLLKIA